MKKSLTASILSILVNTGTIILNAYMWLILTIFKGIGESLGGDIKVSLKIVEMLMIVAIILSFINIIIAIINMIKLKKGSTNVKKIMYVFITLLCLTVICNLVITLLMASWLYGVIAGLNLIFAILIFIDIKKITKKTQV